MKKLFVLALLLSTIISQSQIFSQEIIFFPDPNLEAAVRVVINKPVGDIYQSDVSNITNIDLSKRNITSIEGMQNFTNLTTLVLNFNQVTDITVLSDLLNLELLQLHYNQITDISALSNLTSLTNLYLSSNQVTDISDLSSLSNLNILRLDNNQISEIAALSGLINLTQLNLSSNQINDISILSNITNLTNLWINYNEISDISALSELTSLELLQLHYNQIIDVSGLSNLINLTSLYLSYNQISDITSLSNLINLNILRLDYNQLSEVNALNPLIFLSQLNLSSNQINDISVLSHLVNLANLWINYNQITDISVLSELTSLELLQLHYNQIFDVGALSNLTNLAILYLSYNQISDINALSNLINLKYLYLANNLITDFRPTTAYYYDLLGKDFELTFPENTPPVASTGQDQTAHPGMIISLDGSDSFDPDENYPLTYNWTIIEKPNNSTTTLANIDQSITSLFIDELGNYIIELIVTDSIGAESEPSFVTINTFNSAPIADAGPDQAAIVVGTTITLDGTQSWDEDGDVLTYSWTIIEKPDNSMAILGNSNSATPSFIADEYGTYEFSLTVSDIWSVSVSDEIIVSFENIQPVAIAVDNQACIVGETVYINGNESYDDNGDSLMFMWQFVLKPENSMTVIDSSTAVFLSVVPDLPGEYILSLVVNDGTIDSEPSNVSILAISFIDAYTHKLQQLIDSINSLPICVFKNKNMQRTMTNKINGIIAKVNEGEYECACNQLQFDILAKTNGCAETGNFDKNDWIINCEGQEKIYPLVNESIYLICGDPSLKSFHNDNNYLPAQEQSPNLESIVLYPNPFNEQLYLTGITDNVVITIYSILNEEIIYNKVLASDGKLDLSGLSRSLYFIKLEDEKNVSVRKVIKQ